MLGISSAGLNNPTAHWKDIGIEHVPVEEATMGAVLLVLYCVHAGHPAAAMASSSFTVEHIHFTRHLQKPTTSFGLYNLPFDFANSSQGFRRGGGVGVTGDDHTIQSARTRHDTSTANPGPRPSHGQLAFWFAIFARWCFRLHRAAKMFLAPLRFVRHSRNFVLSYHNV